MGDRFGRIVRLATRRPLALLVVVGVLALAGAGLALRLEPSTATDTLVNRSSESFRETERFKRDFGDEAVLLLVKGDLQRTVLTADLGRLLRLEGCLSGNVPKQHLPRLPRVCSDIARLDAAKVVYGPGTFINTAAGQIADEFVRRRDAKAQEAEQAARAAQRVSARRGDSKAQQRRLANAARNAVMSEFTRDTLRQALRYGLTDIPSIDKPEFVSTLVFDSAAGRPGVPKAKFAYLFPSPNAALVQIRLRPDLSDEERREAIDLFKAAAARPEFKPRAGARYIVTGVPVVAERLASAVQRSIFVLLGAALLVMAATLALVFRTRLRLLPLGLALAAAALTFGALSLAGGSLTMASIAVLPVLIGLAVDYAIQFQARFDEARARRPASSAAEASESAAVAGGPTIATAGLATAVGFLVLLLSPVPMVRGFGLLLVLGIALALACAVTAGFAALVRFSDRPERRGDIPPVLPRLRRRLSELSRMLRESRVANTVADRSWRALDYAIVRPRKVLAIGLAVAVVGWAADTQSEVVSDVRELVPQDLQALRDVNELQEETGVSGEIDVTVRASDITQPRVVAWMTKFQGDVLKAHGYRAGKRCGQAKGAPELCPALSLPDIFSSAARARNRDQVRQLLDAVPPYFSQGVVTPDRRTANLAFGIRLMPLERQKEVVDDIKRRLDPPTGVEASVVGLPVLAAEANGALSSPWRRGLTLLAALAGVFLVLLAVRRSRRAAAIPLIPIALATGWSGGVLFLLGLLPGPLEVDLNPMSVTLGALVIAISTEFSVLLSSRYRQEREAGAGPARAIELTYASTGAAVLASGATAIAGFAALVASDIRMLRDFGIVTVVDLTVSLLGVMVVLPAALLWAEQHGPFALRDLDPRPLLREAWGARPAIRLPRRRSPMRLLRRRSGA
jgi:hydrophobe/amphiphile efflux-3 (HAE3) family protein